MTGVQRYGIEISLQLKKRYGCNIRFLTPYNVLHKDVAKELGAEVIGTHKGYIWEQWDLPRYLKRNANVLLLNLANMAPLAYSNQITAVHDLTYIYSKDVGFKGHDLVYKLFIPLILKRSKHILTVSRYSKQSIAEYYNVPIDKISVIYNACIDKMKPSVDEELKCEQYFFTLASLAPNKNLILTLQAFTTIQKQYPDLKLFIVGRVDLEQLKSSFLEEYTHNKNIKFLGRLSDNDLAKYYSNAIAFIFPSLYEGFGIPPLEAQRCDCPVIVSNVTSLPEIYGNSALYCNPTDYCDLARKMRLLIENSDMRTEYIKLGRKNSTVFSWEESAGKLSNILSLYL